MIPPRLPMGRPRLSYRASKALLGGTIVSPFRALGALREVLESPLGGPWWGQKIWHLLCFFLLFKQILFLIKNVKKPGFIITVSTLWKKWDYSFFSIEDQFKHLKFVLSGLSLSICIQILQDIFVFLINCPIDCSQWWRIFWEYKSERMDVQNKTYVPLIKKILINIEMLLWESKLWSLLLP